MGLQPGRSVNITLHAPQVHGFFRIPVDHLNALNIMSNHFRKRDLTHTVVVSPDLGNAKSASHLARLLNLPVAAGSKRRIDDEHVVIDRIVGDVSGKNVILLDDEIANGGTILEMLRLLREHSVGSVTVACTHGLFTGPAIQCLAAQPDIKEVVTTNTVPLASAKIEALPQLRVLSVAPLLAEAIHRIHDGESISSLFDASDASDPRKQRRLSLCRASEHAEMSVRCLRRRDGNQLPCRQGPAISAFQCQKHRRGYCVLAPGPLYCRHAVTLP